MLKNINKINLNRINIKRDISYNKNISLLIPSKTLITPKLIQFINFNSKNKYIFDNLFIDKLIVSYNNKDIEVSEEDRNVIELVKHNVKKFKLSYSKKDSKTDKSNDNIQSEDNNTENDDTKEKPQKGRKINYKRQLFQNNNLPIKSSLDSLTSTADLVVSFDKDLHLTANEFNPILEEPTDNLLKIEKLKDIVKPTILCDYDYYSLMYNGTLKKVSKLYGITDVKINKIYKRPNINKIIKQNFDNKIKKLETTLNGFETATNSNIIISNKKIKQIESELSVLKNKLKELDFDSIKSEFDKSDIKIVDYELPDAKSSYADIFAGLSETEKEYINNNLSSSKDILLNISKHTNLNNIFPKIPDNLTIPQFIIFLESLFISQMICPEAVIREIYLTKCLLTKSFLLFTYLEIFKNKYSFKWEILNDSKKEDKNTEEIKKKEMQQLLNYLDSLHSNSDTPSKRILIKKLKSKIEDKTFPENINEIFKAEMERLEEMNEQDPEFPNLKQYIETLSSLPFGITSKDNYDINAIRETLDKSHYGMKKIKERILEFMSVGILNNSFKGKIILLYGNPGVGKTSIAKSIAESLNRKFYRIALGGEQDVSILKGHRRTYVGSYPGKIINALKTVQTSNPVILLDEIDKIQVGHKGNIMDVLLEVLDPVQNKYFRDNYIETEVDLSEVIFICSANSLDTITQPLLDRMEIIEINGYTFEEKKNIVLNHLIPNIKKEININEEIEVKYDDNLIEYIIKYYARESGVRNLERQLRKIYDNICYNYFVNKIKDFYLNADLMKEYLGCKIYGSEKLYHQDEIGVSQGLGYNMFGGSVLYIESNIYYKSSEGKESKGNIKMTGSLGDVMKESIEIAYTFCKEYLHLNYNNYFLDVL